MSVGEERSLEQAFFSSPNQTIFVSSVRDIDIIIVAPWAPHVFVSSHDGLTFVDVSGLANKRIYYVVVNDNTSRWPVVPA